MSGVGASGECARVELAVRVRARGAELAQAIFDRIRDRAAGGGEGWDAEYVAGLRTAVFAAIEYGLSGIELGEQRLGPVPQEAVAQVRRAARTGVSLDTVLRRYMLGSTLLGDALMREADNGDFADQAAILREVMSTQSVVLDRLVDAVTCEYELEIERADRSPERHRAERVQHLLAGGDCDALELGYELDGWHVGAIAIGAAAPHALRRVASGLGARMLCVERGEGTAWGWFGGLRSIEQSRVERLLHGDTVARGPFKVSLVLGEPACGVDGWRRTHRQAQAALAVALRRPRAVVRYADVALLASALHDEVLAGSLVEMYLAPLGEHGEGGGVLCETLCAYFAAERNASSAASALGVTRRTVENRLRAVEERLGQKLRTRQPELELALRLEELGEP